MSFKINRIKSEKESYKTTVGWLNDFSKSANFQDRVKERRDRPVVEKFSTIEEKMEDIKNRIGISDFSSMRKESSESNARINVYASKSGGCGPKKGGCGDSEGNCNCTKGCGICDKRNLINSDKELSMVRDRVESLLLYIEKLISDRGYTTKAQVFEHCLSAPDLSFPIISKKIDHEKLENYINGCIKKRKTSVPNLEYIDRDSMADDISFDDMTPSYYRANGV